MEALIDGSNISDEKSWNASISSTLRNTGSVELLAGLKVDWLSNTAGFKVETASERPSPHLVRLLLGRQKGLFVIRNQKSNANGYGKPAEALSEERVQAALRVLYYAIHGRRVTLFLTPSIVPICCGSHVYP